MKIRKTGTGMMLSTITCSWLAVTAMPLYAADGEAVFNNNCKMCHGSGMMGAPKAGDVEAWKPRIAKGKDVLYDHAINGFRDKAMMPPRGGKKSLTDEEVKAAVDYMMSLVE
jgi:cytochrome c5